MVAARADGAAAAELLERGCGLAQMFALELRLLRHAVLPHVVGKLVPASDGGLERLRVELANAAHREDGRLDAVLVEQLDQAPDADTASELALGELHRRLVVEAPQQHGVEVGREVDGDAHAVRPSEIVDPLPTGGVAFSDALQIGNFLAEAVSHGEPEFRNEIPATLVLHATGVEANLVPSPRILDGAVTYGRQTQ